MIAVAVNRKYELNKYIALAGSILSFMLLSLANGSTSTIDWFVVGSEGVVLAASASPLNYLLLFSTLFMGTLSFAYSFRYMSIPSEQKKYYFRMLLLETAMVVLAMSASFMLLFIGWELLSLASYLMVGFWHGRNKANAAARKTFTIMLAGDLALLGAIAIIQSRFGTLVFDKIIGMLGTTGVPVSAALLLVFAILTKSAQFPFHEWLPDAVESPTPASAFLNSSTTKAGVFIAIMLFPILSAAGVLNLLFIFGVITVVVCLLNALREQDIRRVLAYSTCQELGLMLIAISGSALVAAAYFLFVQGFYKALLFFSSGIVVSAAEESKLDKVTGIKQNKLIYFSTLAGVCALVGFFPFSGFFAITTIFSVFATGPIAYLLVSLLCFGTSFSIFRWLTLQEKRPKNPRVTLNYGYISDDLVCCLVALAVFALAVSLEFFVFKSLPTGTAQNTVYASSPLNLYVAVFETAAVAAGAYAARSVYRQRKKKEEAGRSIGVLDLAYTARVADLVYEHIAAFFEAVGGIGEFVDVKINDALDALGHAFTSSGSVLRKLAAGGIDSYVFILAAGLLLLIITALVFMWR